MSAPVPASLQVFQGGESKAGATKAKASKALGDSHEAYAAELQLALRDESGHEPVFAEGKVWTAEKGIWTPRDVRELRNRAALMFNGGKRAVTQRDFSSIVDRLQDRVHDPEFFSGAPLGVATAASFWTIEGGKVVRRDRAAEQRQRFALACEPTFDDDGNPAEAPLFDEFLLETFAGADWREQMELLQQIVGAALLGLLPRLQLAVLFMGVSRAGKGVLVRIIERLFPPSVTTSVSPAVWHHEYHRAALAGMRLNVVGEVDAKRPIPAGDFKSIVGRDLIGARHPTHSPFSFRNEAAHIFSGNTFPPASERDAAFYIRWRIVHFRNSVAGKEDPELADRIVAAEMPAIVAWALKGAERAVARNGLPTTAAHRERLEAWKVEHSSALSFVKDADWVQLVDDGFEKRRPLFEAYQSWCRAEGRHPMGSKSFYDELRAYAPAWGVAEARDRDDNRGFAGLRLAPRP